MELNKLNHVSYSSINTLLGCSHRFHLRYIERIKPDEPIPDYMHVGRLVDRALASAVRKEPASIESVMAEERVEFADPRWLYFCRGIWDARLDIAEEVFHGSKNIELQRAVHFDVIDKETGECIVNDDGNIIKALGYIDGYDSAVNKIIEVKTGDPSRLQEYAHGGQTQLYALGIMEELGVDIPDVEYVFIRKPKIRQKKNESDTDFFARMYEEGINVQVVHVPVVYERDSLTETARYIIDAVHNSVSMQPTKNRTECFQWGSKCEYYDRCWPNAYKLPVINQEEEVA